MPVNENYLAHFEPGKTYHVYNKTNNKELLFRTDENCHYFLNQYNKFISPIADTYAWNLLPTHFHFMIKVKSQDKIMSYVNSLLDRTKAQNEYLVNNDNNALSLSQFKRFFTSYAMAFNTMFKRTGNLFYRTFKRVAITSDEQFTQTLIYIHANAQKHKLVKDFTLHPWTSYHSIVSDKPTRLLKDEVLQWFGGRDQFIETHRALAEYYYPFVEGIEG